MPSIHISELFPIGSKLFQDSETFLNEINDNELQNIKGGASIVSEVNNSAINNTFGNAQSDTTNNGNINALAVTVVDDTAILTTIL
ncbi:bacteriocin [Nostoc sp. 106C]|uniref:bacteriocin n=1 Tax=Nostoc sp. 106C TaxID=1932667 RepID=UPI000A371107|nr:bacteriocin [Nostoc sp. 106C]OUL17857.1 hypothetical protein BV375_35070 [Nostoc sp. 106C]